MAFKAIRWHLRQKQVEIHKADIKDYFETNKQHCLYQNKVVNLVYKIINKNC